MELVPGLRRIRRALDVRCAPLLAAISIISLIALPNTALAQAAGAPAAPAVAGRNPSPNLTPADVIRAQLQALSSPGPLSARIERCYRFASPANREHTGPIDRFTVMIQSPAYRVLLDAKHFLVGRATEQGREAHVLLTVVDSNGNLALFRCFLTRQTAPPYTDCWMTDAVIRIGQVGPAPQPPARQSPSPDTV